MVATRQTELYRDDLKSGHMLLSAKEREELIKPFLPKAPRRKAQVGRSLRTSPKVVLAKQLHLFVYALIHLVFSLYIRLRKTYHVVFDRILSILYYHHRAPELIRQDIKGLDRLPNHLSIILDLKEKSKGAGSLEILMDEVAEVAAWAACAGVPLLSVFEKTGILKHHVGRLHDRISTKLHAYFGDMAPHLQIQAPNTANSGHSSGVEDDASIDAQGHLSMLLLSAEDGRSTLVDLTKTLAEMVQRKKISLQDISQDLVEAEITESVMSEPDILILFGPDVQLQGYPPWQVRLTEIYHVQDNTEVGYQVFLGALHNYAKAHMKFGR